MNRKIMIKIISFILVLMFFSGLGVYIWLEMESIQKDLEICKSLGYDGIKFKGKFTNEVECSNFTDLEKAKKERKK